MEANSTQRIEFIANEFDALDIMVFDDDNQLIEPDVAKTLGNIFTGAITEHDTDKFNNYIKYLKSLIGYCDDQISHHKAVKTSYESRIERILDFIRNRMIGNSQKKISGVTASISMISRPEVIIENSEIVPDQYFRLVLTAPNDEIIAMLKKYCNPVELAQLTAPELKKADTKTILKTGQPIPGLKLMSPSYPQFYQKGAKS